MRKKREMKERKTRETKGKQGSVRDEKDYIFCEIE